MRSISFGVIGLKNKHNIVKHDYFYTLLVIFKFQMNSLTLCATAPWVSSLRALWIRYTLGHTFLLLAGKWPESEKA